MCVGEKYLLTYLRGREREIDALQCRLALQQSAAGEAEARSWAVNPGLPHKWQETNHLSHLPCLIGSTAQESGLRSWSEDAGVDVFPRAKCSQDTGYYNSMQDGGMDCPQNSTPTCLEHGGT